MRTALPLAAIALLALGACASDGAASFRAQELRDLTAECEARNGILTPRQGAETSEVRNNYICEIRGGAPNRTSN